MKEAPLLAHVRRSLHRDLCIPRPVPGPDGSISLPVQDVVVVVRLLPGAPALVQVSATAATGLPTNAGVLREVNDVNGGLLGVRVVLRDGALAVLGELEVVSIEHEELGRLVLRVADTASRVGSMLVAVHGGRRPAGRRDPAERPET